MRGEPDADANAAGTASGARRRAIWRRDSQTRTTSEAANAAMNSAEKVVEVTLASPSRHVAGWYAGALCENEHHILRQIKMTQDANHHLIDMEMTGSNPDTDRIIEVALVSPTALKVVAEAPVWVVHQDDAVLSGMDAGTRACTAARSDRHGKASTRTDGAVEQHALGFLLEHVPAKASPMRQPICQIAGFSRAGCRRSRIGFTTAISTCRR